MFDPKIIPVLNKKVIDISDVSTISVNSNEKDIIYSNYFLLIEKIKLFNEMTQEVNGLIEEIEPYVTHSNVNLREIILSCYVKLKEIRDNIPAAVNKLEGLKLKVVDNFNNIYQTLDGV